jgi:hypothetical protein
MEADRTTIGPQQPLTAVLRTAADCTHGLAPFGRSDRRAQRKQPKCCWCVRPVLSAKTEHSCAQMQQTNSEFLKLLSLCPLPHNRLDFLAEDLALYRLTLIRMRRPTHRAAPPTTAALHQRLLTTPVLRPSDWAQKRAWRVGWTDDPEQILETRRRLSAPSFGVSFLGVTSSSASAW